MSWFSESWDGEELSLQPEDLDDLERLAECALPPAFRALYLQHNGGWPVADSGWLHGFVPVRYGALPIERLWSDVREATDAFNAWLPFAYDPGGNLFALHVGSAATGEVRLYLSGEDRWVPVADSFEQLLSIVPREGR